MLDLKSLNPQQREAVLTTEGPLLVLAGAGSGKTRVLTYRVAHLIEKGVPAWKILAITFTNKAAREMSERISALSGEDGGEVWVSTFHACCARILRRDIEKLGYKRQFAIYDEDDRMQVIKAALKELNLSDKDFPPKLIRAAISDAKNRMLSPDEWLKDSGADYRNQKIAEAYRLYEKALRGNNALDFDDLLLKTLELLVQVEPVREYYQRRFDYILVDEYQDTNAAQYELIRVLTGEKRNLCVVGDDDQSIYGWRGADVRNILDFEKDFPDAKTIKLEQNYRSTGNILDAANQVIAHNLDRKDKALWTDSGEGDRIGLYHALDEREEAAFVARKTADLIKRGARPADIAVLYRTNAQSRVLEEAFVRAGIPYSVYGGQKFYERKEVKDLIAYMRALVNPDDDVSCRRIINSPKRGIGDASVDALAAYAAQSGMPLLSAALDVENAPLSARPKKLIGGFAELMIDLTELLYEKKPGEFFSALLDKTKYVQALEADKTEESNARIENIRELEGAISEFERLNPEGGIADFLENVALVADIDSMNEHGGSVTMMTLHSAKGLEFDNVFLPGMEESIFPVSGALLDETRLEEERRLAYVGITRAKKRLYLSHARTRMLFNSRSANEMSRFVSEIPPRLITEGTQRGMQLGVPAPSARRGAEPYSRGYSGASGYYSVRGTGAKGNALGIPGVQKGFVGSQARQIKNVSLFHAGDQIFHKSLGRGRVVEVSGAGEGQKITVEFESGAKKTLAAAVAPIIKVNG